MKILHPLPDDLLEEYKICQEKTTSLSGNIWKTAIAFGIGSIAGIITLAKSSQSFPENLRPWLLIVLSLLAAMVLLVWKRFAYRWWSIQHAMFRRMEHIERMSKLRTDLYIGYLDKRVEFTEDESQQSYHKPYLHHELVEDLKMLRDNHEIRGIQPVMWLAIEVNIAAWIVFVVLAIAELLPSTISDIPAIVKTIAVSAFAIWFIWRLVVRCQQN